ncbi:MAG: hypothetical protein AAB229_07020, partial [Candidatus Hydrogenedentota bacterium]
SRITYLAAVFSTLVLIALPAQGDGEGMTPAMAIELGSAEISSTVRNSLYYSFTAAQSGIMDITLTPVDGEVDLTVVHYSGSPAVESRREGLAPEEISIRVSRGDKYLVRAISPFGRSAKFRLKGSLEASRVEMAKPVAPPVEYFAPERSSDGRSEATAVDIPLGRVVPVEAMSERFFRTRVPAGYVLSVALFPVHGDADLGVGSKPDGSGWSLVSRRRGLLAERLYMPVSADGSIMIRVNPAPGSEQMLLRYALVTRLHYSGVASMKSAPVQEADPRAISPDLMGEALGSGVPGRMNAPEMGSSKILRLP